MNESPLIIKLHAPNINRKIRHVKILETFDTLNSGQFLELTNDHDPKLLYYQFMIERPETFTWEYIEEGPEKWKVIIGKK